MALVIVTLSSIYACWQSFCVCQLAMNKVIWMSKNKSIVIICFQFSVILDDSISLLRWRTRKQYQHMNILCGINLKLYNDKICIFYCKRYIPSCSFNRWFYHINGYLYSGFWFPQYDKFYSHGVFDQWHRKKDKKLYGGQSFHC